MLRRALALALGTFVVVPLACLEPTEVKLTITSDICDLDTVKVYIGTDVPIASVDEPRQPCANGGRVGTLVFIPTNKGDRFQFRVEGARRNGICGKMPVDCVVASRAVIFAKHTAIDLSVSLNQACLNVHCIEGEETCIDGMCMKIPLMCKMPPCGGDASVSDAVATVDAIQACQLPGPKIAFGPPLHAWSLDEAGPAITDSVTKAVAMVPGSRVAGKCGNALKLDAQSEVSLGVNTGTGVAVRVFFKASNGIGANTTLLQGVGPSQFGNWAIVLVNTGTSLMPQVTVEGPSSTFADSKQTVPFDGAWHELEVSAVGQSVTFSVDGSVPDAHMVIYGLANQLPLKLGFGAPNLTIDELSVYDGVSGN